MLRVLTTLLLCAAAQAATLSTTLNVNGTATVTASGFALTGPAVFTGGFAASGTFAATIPTTALGGTSVNAPFTITFSGGSTLTGIAIVPTAVLLGSVTSASGSASITGGTGSYAGYTGTFSNLTGSGSINNTTGVITLTLAGSGTLTTTGGSSTPTPAVSVVWDAASNTSTLAEGGIFIVKGTNICPTSGLVAFNVPRPTTAPDGVAITFTPLAGGTATNALLWYEDNLGSGNCQLAGILPSGLAVGTYNVTVTSGTSASAAVVVPVAQSKLELFSQDSTGTGLAVIQNIVTATEYDINRFTTGAVNGVTISPAHPLQNMVTYGTGLGPYAAGDNSASGAYYDFSKTMTITAIVGGVSIPVQYAGLAGYPGEDQINFQLPANVPTGCTVSFQISVNGNLSSPTTLAIAPSAGAAACVQPGFTTSQLQNFDNGGSYTIGSFDITQFSESISGLGAIGINAASGSFTKYTGFQLSGTAQYATYTSAATGSCTVTHTTTNNNVTSVVTGTGIGLDAGTVTLNGPAASSITNLPFTEDSTTKSYSLTLAETGIPGGGTGTGTIVAGQYTVAGAGGANVGKFSTSLTIGTPIAITGGLPASVIRSSGLPISWTGGNASDIVEIVGSSSTTSGSGANTTTDNYLFICTTTAGARTFTVPSSILQQLPATSTNGFLEVASSVAPVTFSAPLVAGGNIDAGAFFAFIGTAGTVIYQ
jgi:uncharacterized protein (TIGR03437 family)